MIAALEVVVVVGILLDWVVFNYRYGDENDDDVVFIDVFSDDDDGSGIDNDDDSDDNSVDDNDLIFICVGS